VELNGYWERDGKVYRAIALITDPAIVLEELISGKRETHVCISPLFGEFTKLERVQR